VVKCMASFSSILHSTSSGNIGARESTMALVLAELVVPVQAASRSCPFGQKVNNEGGRHSEEPP